MAKILEKKMADLCELGNIGMLWKLMNFVMAGKEGKR